MAHGHGELACGHRGTGGGRAPFALPGTSRRYPPDRVVDVEHVDLRVAVDPAVRRISGSVRHHVRALADDVGAVTFQARELEIAAVHDGRGRALAWRHVGDELRITLEAPLALGDETELEIEYTGEPRRGLWFVHPDADYPHKPVQAWTQGQDEDSRHWFPCFDHPLQKATSEVRARVPGGMRAVSNGVLVGREEHDDGTTTWHWRLGVRHSAYLVTLVVGDLEEVDLGTADGVPLVAYVEPGQAEAARRSFGRTGRMVEVFGERFGLRYPYERYAQVVVSDFIFGGMENTTATTLVEYALQDERAALDHDADDLVAHELAHQWWGDLLTCRHWSHAWLNEGFATWSESVFLEADKGMDEADWHRQEQADRYLAEDGQDYRRAIVDDRYVEPIDLFDRHLYEKGAWVVHMLRHELGEDAFWRSIATYARDNQGGSVVTDDLRRAVEAATGRSLDWFFDQWVMHGGHPELQVSWSHDADRRVLSVTVKQTQKADDVTPSAFRADLEVHLVVGGSVRTERLTLRDREHVFHVPVEAAPDRVLVDPHGRLLAAWSIDRPPDEHRRVLASDAPLPARVRAARALAKDGAAATVRALAAVLDGPSWPLAGEAAAALAKTRSPEARDALVEGLGRVRHPKARRQVARALGAFRGDGHAAAALRGVVEGGDESLFVEAAAASALGRTRTPGARAVLEAALETRDAWAETIRVGCIEGLAALGDEAVLPVLRDRAARGQHPRVRAAALLGLAQVGRSLARPAALRETLETALDDPDFRVQMNAIVALERLGDAEAAGALDAVSARSEDGRARRTARVAATRLREAGGRGPELSALSDDVDRLKKQNAELASRLERLEQRLEAGGGGRSGEAP